MDSPAAPLTKARTCLPTLTVRIETPTPSIGMVPTCVTLSECSVPALGTGTTGTPTGSAIATPVATARLTAASRARIGRRTGLLGSGQAADSTTVSVSLLTSARGLGDGCGGGPLPAYGD